MTALPLGFSKNRRLLRRSDFRRTYESGRRLTCPAFALFVKPNELGTSRLGITVTKKLGGSVVRNRMKRRLREAFRQDDVIRGLGIDVVVNAREAVQRIVWTRLRDELRRLCLSSRTA